MSDTPKKSKGEMMLERLGTERQLRPILPRPPVAAKGIGFFFDELSTMPHDAFMKLYFGKPNPPAPRRVFYGHPSSPPAIVHIVDQITYKEAFRG